jgi:L-asparaginase II
MYAQLVAPPEHFDEATRAACKRIVAAMISFPELIGGTTERLDTEMMRAARGRLISKVGAEGVYTVGVLPCAQWPSGLGLALKIEDGENFRARPTVVIEARASSMCCAVNRSPPSRLTLAFRFATGVVTRLAK